MERNLPSPPASPNPLVSPNDIHFQVSLLRLMYPGSTASAQVARLEQLREPAEVVLARY